jgi:hypothetical protein
LTRRGKSPAGLKHVLYVRASALMVERIEKARAARIAFDGCPRSTADFVRELLAEALRREGGAA